MFLVNDKVRSSECTWRSPEMFAPARIPVAAGKNMEKTEKKPFPSRKSGFKFCKKTVSEIEKSRTYDSLS